MKTYVKLVVGNIDAGLLERLFDTLQAGGAHFPVIGALHPDAAQNVDGRRAQVPHADIGGRIAQNALVFQQGAFNQGAGLAGVAFVADGKGQLQPAQRFGRIVDYFVG